MTPTRIGYAPIAADLQAPGDRRRFCFYAARRELAFDVVGPPAGHDLVVLSSRADIVRWSRVPSRDAKLVYDLVDSYLALPGMTPSSLGRGAAKFLTRENSRPALNYRRAIKRMCQRADAIVCSTVEQREALLEFNPNVHVILDSHTTVATERKDSYRAGRVFNLVWEGLPYTLSGFRDIAEVLRELDAKHPLALHLITDLRVNRYSRGFGSRETAALTRRFFDRCYLYEWNEQLFARIATGCDLGVIPLDLSDPFARGKPENKLLLLWRMGIPAVVSATPAYLRVLSATGLPMACANAADWQATLAKYMESQELRAEAGRTGAEFAESHAGDERLLERWDAVFESVSAMRNRRSLPASDCEPLP
jgi:glycosyltransferase involved in cell wall biosynthesis